MKLFFILMVTGVSLIRAVTILDFHDTIIVATKAFMIKIEIKI